MKLIRTHDGMLGWQAKDDKIKWCSSVKNLKAQGPFIWNFEYEEFVSFCKEVDYALEHMARTGDSIAHFGVFGSFMFTTTEAEHEF